MPTLPGMKLGGFYNQNSSFQQSSMEAVIGWGSEAIAAMPLPDEPCPIILADYGCSEGKNSILAAAPLVEAFRRRRATQPVCVIHTDLPGNNFNQLFLNLHDPRNENYFQAGGAAKPGIFPMASSGSFFGPLLAPRSVHFAMSFLAVEWMDRVPDVPVPEFIGYMEGSPAAQEAFARQADEDLARFYAARAGELAPGGKLLVAIPGRVGTRRCSDGLYNALNDAALDLVDAGRVTRERYERFVMPVYFRSQAELMAPLMRAGGTLQAAFAIDRAETLELPVPFEEELKQTGDLVSYARAYTGFLRAFSEPVVAGGLFEAGHAAAEVDALYDRVRSRVTSEPARYRVGNIEVAILLTRR